jgi:tetratricopeptide (TPR) repeat protein
MNDENNNIIFQAARCPNCGGEFNLSSTNKIVKCSYCNADVIIREKSRSNASVDEIKLKNLIELAYSAEKSRNYIEAFKYYTKILEYDSENTIAWYGKGVSAWHLSTDDGKRINDVITCFEKVIEIEPDTFEFKDQMGNFLFEKIQETHVYAKQKYDAEFLPFSKSFKSLSQSAKKKLNDNYSSILSALELSWKISPDVKIGEYVIKICREILEQPFSQNFEITTNEKANALLDDFINNIKNISPDWKQDFILKNEPRKIKYTKQICLIICLFILIFLTTILINKFSGESALDILNVKSTLNNVKIETIGSNNIYVFNGNDSSIELSNFNKNFFPSDEFSICFFIKPEKLGEGRHATIISSHFQNGNWWNGISLVGDKIEFVLQNAFNNETFNWYSDTPIVIGKWQHIAVGYKNNGLQKGSVTMHINGKSVGVVCNRSKNSRPFSTTFKPGYNPLDARGPVIGCLNEDKLTAYYKGCIYGLEFYSKTIEQWQINKIISNFNF